MTVNQRILVFFLNEARDTDKNKVVLTNNLQQRGASKLRREIEFVLIYQTKALQITEDDFHITNDRRKQRKKTESIMANNLQKR